MLNMFKNLFQILSFCLIFMPISVLGTQTTTSAKENIWYAIGKKIDTSSYQHNYAVQKQIRWYIAHQDSLRVLTQNAQPYIYYVATEVQRRKMPIELALLPMIESDYMPNRRSEANANGLWQLMPNTARALGLNMNHWYDGRNDVVASTHAALTYLQHLQAYFHSWPLTFAAYNAGIGTVNRAIFYNKTHHRPTDYWSLPLPQQTKEYVPKLLAIATILANPSNYHLDIYPVKNTAYFDAITINTPLSLSKVAELSHTNIKMIQALNPAFIQEKPMPATHYHVLIPVNNTIPFSINLAHYVQKIKSPSARTKIYLVKNGDSLSKIANQYHITLTDLRDCNKLTTSLIRVGQSIYIPESTEA